METEDISQILFRFYYNPFFFTSQDILKNSFPPVEKSHLEALISNDNRFLHIKNNKFNLNGYISLYAVYKKFIYLNHYLSRIGVFKLSSRQIASVLSSLFPTQLLNEIPIEIINFGNEKVLIKKAYELTHYIFPLANIMSFFSDGLSLDVRDSLLDTEEIINKQYYQEKTLVKFINEILNLLPERSRYILESREDLNVHGKKTLDQLGAELGLSRERIRQLEKKANQKLTHYSKKRILAQKFIIDLINRQGDLLVPLNSSDISYRLLTLTYLNIPYTALDDIKYIIIGSRLDYFDIKNYYSSDSNENPNVNQVADLLAKEIKICLSQSEIISLSEKATPLIINHITKIQKVYLSLKSIGKPAHYTQVTKEYMKLFPNDYISERYIHSILGSQRNDVVWAGINGVYALKPWGFINPSKTLHDEVAEIIEIFYARTGKPVHINIIVAELKKYRRLIKDSSLQFSLSMNPKIEKVSKNYYMPKSQDDKEIAKPDHSNLDKLLQGFEPKSTL